MTRSCNSVRYLAVIMLGMWATAWSSASTSTIDRVSGWYPAGSNLVVTATAGSYSKFSVWSGDTNGCAISDSQITVLVNMARTITAVFVPKKTIKGTTELWLASYSLTNGTPDQVDLVDSDGDGLAAWQEYIAGTDPTNKVDYFGVEIASSNGVPLVSVESRATTPDIYGTLVRRYALERLPSMGSTNWAIVPGYSNVAASDQIINIPISSPTNLMFYRGKVWLE